MKQKSTTSLTLMTLLLTTFILFSCGGKSGTSSLPPKAGETMIAAIWTNKDSTKQWGFLKRFIGKDIRTDSVKKTDFIIYDTAWAEQFPIMDTIAKKPKYDSLGRMLVNYNFKNKDSVNWQFIEGIPADSLLSKSWPPRGKKLK